MRSSVGSHPSSSPAGPRAEPPYGLVKVQSNSSPAVSCAAFTHPCAEDDGFRFHLTAAGRAARTAGHKRRMELRHVAFRSARGSLPAAGWARGIAREAVLG